MPLTFEYGYQITVAEPVFLASQVAGCHLCRARFAAWQGACT